MPVEIDGFLSAYSPKAICIPCLVVVTGRGEDDVRQTVTMLVAERRATTHVAECFNCNETALDVRRS